MTRWEVSTNGPAATRRLGRKLGRLLVAGDVALLSGELGSGKTCLVQGVALGLGVKGPVTSKTFVLLGEYQGRLPLYHADLYRLAGVEEAEELALVEYAGEGVLIVEWPERAWEVFPQERLLVELFVTGVDERRLVFQAEGEHFRDVVARLAEGEG